MNILIVGWFRFPEGDAESVRLHAIGKALRDSGNNVSYVGMGYHTYMQSYTFDGFEYTTLRKKYKNIIEKFYFYFNYSYRLEQCIMSKIKEQKIDCILFADISPYAINTLKKICKKNNIKIISDSVEWYSPEQFKLGNMSPGMILKNIEIKYTINKNVKVIAISKYLEKYFKSKDCEVIRIPIILDVENIPFEKKCLSDKLTILYAGAPGKKDYVEKMLRGILLLNDDERGKLQFILAGVSNKDIEVMFSREDINKLEETIHCLGRVSRKIVLEKLAEADFTVLLRSSEQRYAKAGFPTKVVESLSTGTPVILNLTSDLGEYLQDRRECLIVKECTSKAFSETLKYAITLTNDKITEMKKNARICAEKNFDYRHYIDSLSKFIEIDNK